MMVVVNPLKCTGCAFCVPVCPNRAITSLGRAEVDKDRCVACLECLDFCPATALGKGKNGKESHES
ncbi:MAG: 4Fe-4S dicluster domain-containing protein [Desulfobacteraceae bacterium]|nr:4Fe-4S dicluster domain-containing protein [Desulfobacteraceae bacterium]